MTTPAITREMLEYGLASKSFRDCLRYVKVLETQGDGTETGAVVPFVLWPHLATVTELLTAHKLLVWLKARQIGASWLLAAYALWVAMHTRGANVLMLSKGEHEAAKLLEKVKFIYEHLPPPLQVPTGRVNQSEMTFPLVSSTITVLPSTEHAGRSETATLVIFDEADFHPYLDANYRAIKPAADMGGQLVMISTSDYTTTDSLFKRLYQAAPDNGFTPVFFGWDVRPGRDAEWYERTMRSYPDRAEAEKEYPSDAEQALAPPQTLAAFDLAALRDMQAQVREPIETNGATHIWQRYYTGRKYTAFSDTSHGVGGDDSVTVVLDVASGIVVADVQSNILAVEEFALRSRELLALYHDPVWGIEDNDWGVLTLRTAQELAYPHLYRRRLPSGEDGPLGWRTDARSRWVLWGELQEAVSTRLLTIPSGAGLHQFFTAIRNPEKQGRLEASGGAHDDYVLAVGGAWQMRKHATHAGTPQRPRLGAFVSRGV